MKVYINGLGSVSCQEGTRNFKSADLTKVSQGLNQATQPSYKDLIPAGMLRRMAKGVKMGIYASHSALEEANITVPDAVITGTGLGCLIDSEKFLCAMLENNESYLTPTSFIQSTHNTVGGQIALQLQCMGYNFTYVHQNTSFESALLDALLQVQAGELDNALIGGVDEIGDMTMHFLQLAKKINTTDEVFTKGVNYGEGATFMVLENRLTAQSYAEVVDTDISNRIDSVPDYIKTFLARQSLTPNQIEVLVVGSNQTANDGTYYSEAQNICSNSVVETFKEFSGEYHTASAFGLLNACEMLKYQQLFSTGESKSIEYILIYNQFDGKDHSLTLLKKC
ncbi:beta-ketoacyl synthase chain length factor [Myroides marinus]|uniref:beta-ketoacyl synthase N-terminal-like domain-containing protein n=1 Tax=Myroides marinus TaxID=703342 RepID=UPI00257646F0|nr:beta-ketoacyl synthase N-terminal-like domain-containing protein [Myroides marinus]MDM1367481.1 beta-ketoacyl synthase chain length factor [Myroides marinus]MDM1370927.1 beta-ketoacyl synthase chain length factor [Myroides marinus]MDM1373980.1 beta-ketoacyl synthase chain length factor [Myroides marinus]MDM1383002.1 beta-ketoacyl synthase chain length factor [Myroides marinus]MDM1388453.1 beta-ketoacyl synthase chain length factor [Myroides marinus]